MCFLHLHVGGAFDSHVQFLEICHVHHDTDVRNKSGWTVEFLEAFMENWVKEFDFERFVIFFLLFFFFKILTTKMEITHNLSWSIEQWKKGPLVV